MSDWRSTTWGEEISLEYGKAIKGYQNAVAPYRVYGTNGPVGYTETPLAPGPGIILGRKGAYRGVRYSPAPFFVIDTAYYVRPKSSDLRMRWLYYAMIYHKLGEIDDGSPIPSTTRAAVYVCNLRVPPIEEQDAISEILGALDDKIELNQRMNETLEAAARAIFKDWFVDFGPVRAKAEGREPYLPPELWALFPDALDGEGIPAGWRQGQVSDFAQIKGGQQLTKDKFADGGPVPVFGGAGVMGCTDRHNADGFVITVGRVGAYCGQFFSHRGKAWVNNNASLITPNPEVPGEWLFLALRSLDINLIKKGAAQPFVSNSDVLAMKMVDPGHAALSAFHALVKSPTLRGEANNIENASLAQTRDALLPKLMSGEINLRDAESAAAKAL